MKLIVTTKDVYGKTLIYPKSPAYAVTAVQRLTGKITLSASDIEYLRALDIEVVHAPSIAGVLLEDHAPCDSDYCVFCND